MRRANHTRALFFREMHWTKTLYERSTSATLLLSATLLATRCDRVIVLALRVASRAFFAQVILLLKRTSSPLIK